MSAWEVIDEVKKIVRSSFRSLSFNCHILIIPFVGGDIDLLITRDTSDGIDHTGMIAKLVSLLKKRGLLKAELAVSDDPQALDVKINGLIQLPGGLMRRIDLLGVPDEEMPAALIYFTGNDVRYSPALLIVVASGSKKTNFGRTTLVDIQSITSTQS